ncbi:MAG: PKD-like domain-containing protein, partial [Bacteroidales bacterium]
MRKIYLLFIFIFLCNLSYTQIHVTITNPLADTIICQGTSINFISNVTGGIGIINYKWLIDTTTVGNISNYIYTATYISTSNYNDTIRVIVTNGNGIEKDTAQIIVTIKPRPIITVNTPSSTICNGQCTDLTASGSSTSYTWMPGNLSGATVNVCPNDTTTYIVTGWLIGCVSNSNITIIVKPTPITPTASTPINYCKNDVSAPVTAMGTNLQWYSTSTGGTGSTIPPTPSTSIVTTLYYYVSQKNTYGCESARKQIDVTVNPLPTPGFTIPANTPQCSGSIVTYTNTSSNSTSFLWKFDDGQTGNSTNTNPNINHVFDVVGKDTIAYTTWLVATSQYGCKDSISHLISVKKRPDASLKSDGTGGFVNSPPIGTPTVLKKCALNPPTHILTLSNLSTTAATNVNYNIIYGQNDIYNNAVFDNGSHTYLSAGSYNLINTVKGGNGCQSTRQYEVYIGTNPGGSIVTPSNTALSFCAPHSFDFPLSNNVFNNTPGTQYQFLFNDGTPTVTYDQSELLNLPFYLSNGILYYPHSFNSGSCNAPNTHNVQQYSNSFYIKLNISNACANTPSTAQPIVLENKPITNFTISQSPYCVSSNITLTDSTFGACSIYYDNGNYVSYQGSINRLWEITPNTYSITNGSLTSTPLVVKFNNPGNYSIKYSSNGNTCGDSTVVKNICIDSIPVPLFSINKSIFCLTDTVKFTNSTDTTKYCSIPTYTWNISCTNNSCDGSNCNSGYSFLNGTSVNSKNPIIKFTQSGIFSISLTVKNSCTPQTSAPKLITVKNKPTITYTVPASVCANSTICPSTVTVTNCYGVNASTYNWTSSNGIFTSPTTLNPGCVAATSGSSQTITLDATNECGTNSLTKSVTINPLPTVTQINNIEVCPGATISIGNFSSSPTGATYTWTNSNTNIGKPANGIGNITSWTAPANNTALNIVGTITVIPTLSSCIGSSMSFTVTIKPKPVTNSISNLYYCPESIIPTQTFTSTPIGATYTWTNSYTAIGIGSNGSINIPSWTAPNNIGISNISGNISVIPTLNGCIGSAMVYSINIYPKPTVNVINNISVCPGDNINIGAFASIPTGATFTWTNNNTNIGLGSNGNGNIGSWIASTNNTGANIVATITVIPTLNGCIGTSRTFTITVKPKPVLDTISSQTICSGQSSTTVTLNSNVAGATYNWISSVNGSITPNPGSGNTNSINGKVFTNNNGTASIITYNITPTANLCAGNVGSFTIIVNPAPYITTQPQS